MLANLVYTYDLPRVWETSIVGRAGKPTGEPHLDTWCSCCELSTSISPSKLWKPSDWITTRNVLNTMSIDNGIGLNIYNGVGLTIHYIDYRLNI